MHPRVPLAFLASRAHCRLKHASRTLHRITALVLLQSSSSKTAGGHTHLDGLVPACHGPVVALHPRSGCPAPRLQASTPQSTVGDTPKITRFSCVLSPTPSPRCPAETTNTNPLFLPSVHMAQQTPQFLMLPCRADRLTQCPQRWPLSTEGPFNLRKKRPSRLVEEKVTFSLASCLGLPTV